jgi:hypothetical protein
VGGEGLQAANVNDKDQGFVASLGKTASNHKVLTSTLHAKPYHCTLGLNAKPLKLLPKAWACIKLIATKPCIARLGAAYIWTQLRVNMNRPEEVDAE